MKIGKRLLIFLAGGWCYVCLELLWRGRSHVSMFAAGGLCLLLVGWLEEAGGRLPRSLRVFLGAGAITLVELVTGLLVNRDYSVWDYRHQWGNVLGQICPVFCLLWIPVSALAGKTYRWLDRILP